jgi:cobaltochelatase CobS
MNTVTCQICGESIQGTLYSHLSESHQSTAQEYLNQYPGAPLVAPELLNQLQSGQSIKRTPVQTSQPKDQEFRIHDAVLQKRTGSSPLVPKCDPHYQFPPETAFLMHAVNYKENVMLVGPTGTGKSSLIMQLAAQTNTPLRRCNLNGETTVSDFLGRWTVRGKEMVYSEGILPTAIKQGDWLLLDEIDAALPQILFVLQSVLEEGGKLVLLEKDSEVIAPHSDFRIIATANTIGNGDESGLYAGTQILNEAFKDRFATVIYLDYPDEKTETEIISQKVSKLKKTDIRKLVKCARQVREAAMREECYCSFSTRRLLAFARKYDQLGNLSKALELTVLNKLSKDDSRVVAEIAQRHLGTLMSPNPTKGEQAS